MAFFEVPPPATSPSVRQTNQDNFLKWENNLIRDKQLFLHGVALFGGNSTYSVAIRVITQSRFSHATIILKDQFGISYIFESTESAERMLAGIFPQVQISLFDERLIDAYDGSVGIRKFLTPSGADFSDSSNKIDIADFVHQYLATPYKEDKFDMVRAVYRYNTTFDPKSLFCSELVAFVLQQEGLMNTSVLPNNYIPVDFDANNPQNTMNPAICSLGAYVPLSTKKVNFVEMNGFKINF